VLAESVRAVLDELCGRTFTDPKTVTDAASQKKLRHIMTRCVQVQQRFWKTLAA
jgi:hypothetical protein